MDLLPDEVVLEVLQYLPVPDLLNCRLVSRRLGALALHPTAWRWRALDSGDRWVRPVLRVAPCVRVLEVEVPPKGDDPPPYANTRCAAEELQIIDSLPLNGPHDVRYMYAALVIRNQEALGRLRRLVLDNDFDHCTSPACASVLFNTLASTSGLEVIDLRDCCLHSLKRPFSMQRAAVEPSIRTFSCDWMANTAPFVNAVLTAHASTLKEVDLRDGQSDMSDEPSSHIPLTAPLLAALPRLQKLSTPLICGMEVLATCASLTDVTLTVDEYMAAAMESAVKFLRTARQVREIYLSYSSTDFVADLIQALGPCVRSLSVRSTDYIPGRFPHLRALARTLPSLTGLQKLLVDLTDLSRPHDELMDEMLRSIRPSSTPELEKLELVTRVQSDRPCMEAWRQVASVSAMLRLNPQLNLHISGLPDRCPPSEEHCSVYAAADAVEDSIAVQ